MASNRRRICSARNAGPLWLSSGRLPRQLAVDPSQLTQRQRIAHPLCVRHAHRRTSRRPSLGERVPEIPGGGARGCRSRESRYRCGCRHSGAVLFHRPIPVRGIPCRRHSSTPARPPRREGNGVAPSEPSRYRSRREARCPVPFSGSGRNRHRNDGIAVHSSRRHAAARFWCRRHRLRFRALGVPRTSSTSMRCVSRSRGSVKHDVARRLTHVREIGDRFPMYLCGTSSDVHLLSLRHCGRPAVSRRRRVPLREAGEGRPSEQKPRVGGYCCSTCETNCSM